MTPLISLIIFHFRNWKSREKLTNWYYCKMRHFHPPILNSIFFYFKEANFEPPRVKLRGKNYVTEKQVTDSISSHLSVANFMLKFLCLEVELKYNTKNNSKNQKNWHTVWGFLIKILLIPKAYSWLSISRLLNSSWMPSFGVPPCQLGHVFAHSILYL